MMKNNQIWDIGLSVVRSLGSNYERYMNEAAREYGLEPPNWYLLTAAITFKPDPTSVKRLRVRFPYGSTRYWDNAIQALLDCGLFARSPLGGYSLTEKGEQATLSIMNAAYQAMATMSVLPEDEMRSLANSLGRLVQECLINEPHISKWGIIYSRMLDKSPQGNFTAKTDQYLSDLASYRDDSHLASWRHYEVNGHAWDILSIIWKEGTSSIDQISERLVNKKWTREETIQAIEDLRELGWIKGSSELTITETGNQIRVEAEHLTNQYFFAPWDSAAASDLETISALLPELNDLLIKE